VIAAIKSVHRLATCGMTRQPTRPVANDTDPWKAHFAEIDILLERTSTILAGEMPLPKRRSHLVYDPDGAFVRSNFCRKKWGRFAHTYHKP
jgi:hypothetical protein